MNYFDNTCGRMLAYRPPRIAMALLGIAALPHLLSPSAASQLQSFGAAGAALAATGFGIMIRAWWLFRQHETAICPTAETKSFITDDIYAITRNPMYLGMVMILFGVALLIGGWPFYVAAATYALILNHVFCRYEETKLLTQYGKQYASYALRVRRWL